MARRRPRTTGHRAAGDRVRRAAGRIGLGESPRWHDGRLWFADGRRVCADLGDGARDGSASTRRARSDTGDVPNKRCVSVREVVSCWRRSTSTGGCFACSLGGPDRTTLFMLAAEWGGPERVRRNREPGEC
jgi:hypothetical protein